MSDVKPGDFQDLDELIAPEAKTLPIGGRMVRFPDRVDAETGMKLLRLYQVGREDPAAAKDGDALMRRLFGEDGAEQLMRAVFGGPGKVEELVATGTSITQVMHVFKTLIVWHLMGRDAAIKAWGRVDDPGEAPAPNRAARRTASKTAAPARRTTKASTAGTTSRGKAPAASRGRGSSKRSGS